VWIRKRATCFREFAGVNPPVVGRE
jgi:hypothetical protein